MIFSPFKEFHNADDHVYATVSSSIFTAGGQCTTDRHCPTKTLSVRGDTEPDQLCVPASFFSISLNGNRLSLEPAWRQFWISNVHFNFCTVFAICQGGNDLALLKGKGQLHTPFILHWLCRWWPLDFLGSFHRPIPVRYNWSAFARKMHSTTKFDMTVLSKCVSLCM